MSIPLKFKLSTEGSSAYATTKTGTGNATLNVFCPLHTGRAQRTQSFGVTVGTATQYVTATQAGAAVDTTMDSPSSQPLAATSTTVSVTGTSNSNILSFSIDSTGGLAASISSLRWMGLEDTDTGSNGTQFTNGTLITGDPGLTEKYKFVVTLTFQENANPTSRSLVLSVTDSTQHTVPVRITQAGSAYLTVSPSPTDFEAPATSGSQTFTISTNGTPSVASTSSGLVFSAITKVSDNTYTVTLSWGRNANSYSKTLGQISFSIAEDSALTIDKVVNQQGASSRLSIVGADTMAIGETLTLQAQDNVNHTPTIPCDWSVSDNNLASISVIDPYTCTVTALGNGSFSVYADSVGYATASHGITVSGGTLTISDTWSYIEVGTERSLFAYVNGIATPVTWTISDTTKLQDITAQEEDIDENELPLRALANGSVTITASLAGYTDATLTVTVFTALTSITYIPDATRDENSLELTELGLYLNYLTGRRLVVNPASAVTRITFTSIHILTPQNVEHTVQCDGDWIDIPLYGAPSTFLNFDEYLDSFENIPCESVWFEGTVTTTGTYSSLPTGSIACQHVTPDDE